MLRGAKFRNVFLEDLASKSASLSQERQDLQCLIDSVKVPYAVLESACARRQELQDCD